MESFDALLHEAQSTTTKSERLWAIKDSDFSGLTPPEIRALVSALADHPNADEDLCTELLREWPKEALASTRVRLVLLADGEIDWRDILDEFCDAVPALNSLLEIPSSHKAVIGLFETELLRRVSGLSCSFDWNMSFSHEISVRWQPANDQESEDDGREDLDEKSQDFTLAFTATIDSGNCAVLTPPDRIKDIQSIFNELDSCDGGEMQFEVLKRHGWSCEVDTTGDGGYFLLESVEPELDGWELGSCSVYGDGSGTLYVSDPSGREREIELPAYRDIEDSFDNYRLDEELDLSGIFDHDTEAMNSFRRIINFAPVESA